MDSEQKFLALVILKSWKYTVLVEAHDKLGHQGNTHTYCLIKIQYYWKGMNKDNSEIYCKLHALFQREGQDSELPSSNDGNPQQTI